MPGGFHVPERVPAGKRPLTIFICVFVFFSLLMVRLWIGCNQARYRVPTSV